MELPPSSTGSILDVRESSTVIELELRNLCRMCARFCTDSSELAAIQFSSDPTLTENLRKYFNIMVEEDIDLMPKQLCQECYFALGRWNEILEIVRKSADFFQKELSKFGVTPQFLKSSDIILPAEINKPTNFSCAMCNIKYPDFDSLVDHELTHLPDHVPVNIKAVVTNKRKLVRKRTKRKVKNSSESSSEEDDVEDRDFEASVPAVSQSKRISTRKCYVEGHLIECSVCNSAFQEPSEFLSHLESHPEDSSANCSICSCKFSSTIFLSHHIQEHIKNEFKPLQTFPCRKCKSGPFATTEALEAHVSLTHPTPAPKPISPFPCGLCSLGFDEFVDYSKHIQTHVNFRHFPCALCGCKFTKVPYLLEHVKQHANGNSRQITFMCEICPDQVFSSKHNLASHMTKKHRINANKARSSKTTVAFDPGFFSFPSGSEVTGVSLQCGLCDEVFTSCPILASHIEEVHSKFKHLLCKKCHCKFTKLPYYLEHMSEHFANPDKNLAIPCEACDEIFSSKHNLSKHIYKKHRNNYSKLCAQKQNPRPEELALELKEEPKFEIEKDPKTKQFHCKNCPLTFKNATLLNNHLLVHVPNKCPTCHGLFETREQLKEHLTQKCRPEEKFPCPICGKQLASKQSMRIHMSLHSSERKYVCEVCAKSYRTQSALVSHRNVVHLQKSQFMCHICARTFSFKLAMKRHVMLHMGDLPHKCNICPKAFVTSNLLKIHNSKEHERRILHYCTSCKKGFVDIIGLRRHMRMVCKVPEYAIPYIRDRQFVKHSL